MRNFIEVGISPIHVLPRGHIHLQFHAVFHDFDGLLLEIQIVEHLLDVTIRDAGTRIITSNEDITQIRI